MAIFNSYVTLPEGKQHGGLTMVISSTKMVVL